LTVTEKKTKKAAEAAPETTEKKPAASTVEAPQEHAHDHDHAGHDHTHDHEHEHSHQLPPMNEVCKREVSVEIPADVVAGEMESFIKKYQKLARLPGFRKGKTPATIIKQRFAGDLRSEVLESLVPKYLREAIAKQKLDPISQPAITDLKMDEGKPWTFKAAFEIMPEISLADYSDVKPEKKDVSVRDKEVEEALEHLREQQASFDPVEDRAIENKDYAQVSFVGTPKSVATPKGEGTPQGEGPAEGEGQPVNVDDIMVEIGGINTVAEFSDNLRGAKAGEVREFEVSYPEDFQDKRLAGKTVSYSVTIKSIKKKTLPELNDDFAKSIGNEFTSVAELRDRIRNNMEAERKHSVEHEAKDKLVEELVKRNEFPIPESLVERQIDTRLERGLRALAAQGMRAEDMRKMDMPRLRAGQREGAIREVKASLILEKVAEKEKIEVSDEEVQKEIDALAAQTQQTPAEIRARLTRDGALERIKDRMRNEKALELLYRGKSA
jgi:trigger factor